jgi:hypothetical protein
VFRQLLLLYPPFNFAVIYTTLSTYTAGTYDVLEDVVEAGAPYVRAKRAQREVAKKGHRQKRGTGARWGESLQTALDDRPTSCKRSE